WQMKVCRYRVCLALIGLIGLTAKGEDKARVRRLLGFEPEEIEAIANPHLRDGKPQWRLKAGYPYDLGPRLTQQDASEGRQALARSYQSRWEMDFLKSSEQRRRESPGVYSRVATLLRTSGWQHLCFGTNWTGFARLWFDAKTSDAAATLTLALRDEYCPLAISRTWELAPGKWVTLEFDLEGAASAGLLDLSCITDVRLMVQQIAGPTTIFVDNFRLATLGAPRSGDVLTDNSPWPVWPEPPEEEGRTTRPKVLSRVLKPSGPLGVPVGELPVTLKVSNVAWNDPLYKVPRGIAAVDAQRLISIFMGPVAGVRQSIDGGQRWTGLAGDTPTTIAAGVNTANRHGFFCSAEEILALYITHCAGGGSPTETYFRRVDFDGERWNVSDVSVVDSDVYHCPEWYEVIRLRDGRLWAAWDHYDRRHRVRIRAKFSDDNGRTWQHGGGRGYISDPVPLGSMPMLAAYEEHGVMCLWRTGQDQSKRVVWSRFDQEKFDETYAAYKKQKPQCKVAWDRFAESAWTPPASLPVGQTLVSVVGTPEGCVFASVRAPDGVLIWDGARWSESLDACSGLLTYAGTKIVLFSLEGEGKLIFLGS
ncbi:MAG: sialidase family protein, partial [Kiritimatiellia bacterium]